MWPGWALCTGQGRTDCWAVDSWDGAPPTPSHAQGRGSDIYTVLWGFCPQLGTGRMNSVWPAELSPDFCSGSVVNISVAHQQTFSENLIFSESLRWQDSEKPGSDLATAMKALAELYTHTQERYLHI